MEEKTIDYLIFSAEKREVASFLIKAEIVNERSFYKIIKNKKILIIITGVGKQSVKKTLKNQQSLLEQTKAKKIFNLGNAGSLTKIPPATILKIGICSGNNGKESIVLDESYHLHNITVNSMQNKKKLLEQFPNATTVDMELSHLVKAYPTIISYKIIIDTISTNPKSLIFKIFLPFFVKKNDRLLYSFFVNTFCV